MFLAVQNIFDNAIKYSKVGGEVNVSFGSDGKNFNLKIKDHGIGILDSEKEKIFTEFFRGQNARNHGAAREVGLHDRGGQAVNSSGSRYSRAFVAGSLATSQFAANRLSSTW